MSTLATPHPPHTTWRRLVITGVALAAVVCILVLAFIWPSVTASVKGLPIAVAGGAAPVAALEASLAQKSPGTFAIIEVGNRDAAIAAIEHRSVYGAIVLARDPEVLTASAASPLVAQLLSAVAPALQAGPATTQGGRSAVDIVDVVPLATTDPRGAGLGAASFPLVLGGMLGGILISTLVVGVWRRVITLLTYSVSGGLAITAIMHGWFGVLQGDYLANAAAIALALMSIGSVITGVVSVVGRPGIAIGPVLFLLIANPISSAAQPPEFLAGNWGALGQLFPPGAASTLLRDLSYFPAADVVGPWLVLGSWVAAGLALSGLGHFRISGAATRAALEAAEA